MKCKLYNFLYNNIYIIYSEEIRPKVCSAYSILHQLKFKKKILIKNYKLARHSHIRIVVPASQED